MQHRPHHHQHLLLLLTLLTLLTSLSLATSHPSPSPSLPDFFFPSPGHSSSSSNYIPPVCRFASPHQLPNPTALLTNATLRSQFVQSLLYWEGRFLQPSPCTSSCCHFRPPSEAVGPAYIGLHEPTMMTMDGHRLSIPSGLPLDGGAHMFTASSKESCTSHCSLSHYPPHPLPHSPHCCYHRTVAGTIGRRCWRWLYDSWRSR